MLMPNPLIIARIAPSIIPITSSAWFSVHSSAAAAAGARGRDRRLQGAGNPDEEPLGGDDDADRDHDLGRHPQPHQPRVGRRRASQATPAGGLSARGAGRSS